MASTSKSKILPAKNFTAKIQDINHKMAMASIILKTFKNEQQHGDIKYKRDEVPIDNRIAFYTKQDINLIFQARDLMKCERNVTDLENAQKESKVIERSNERDLLRDVIMEFYIKKHYIPSQRCLINEMLTRGIPTANEPLSLDLKVLGFTWVRLPRTDKTILVEKPEHAYKIQRYLEQIARYRKAGRSFVYIEERSYNTRGLNSDTYELDPSQPFFIIVTTSSTGETRTSFFTHVQERWMEILLTELVIPQLTEPSVLVLADKKHHIRTSVIPNEFSTKNIMRDWLKTNNIPFNPFSHRADMYKLIQYYKGNFNQESYYIDGLVKAHGHVVIRRPYGITKLNFFEDIINKLTVKMKSTPNQLRNVILELTNEYTMEEWAKVERELIVREQQVYEECMHFETITDQLMTIAKDGLSNEDLSSLTHLATELPDDQNLCDVINF